MAACCVLTKHEYVLVLYESHRVQGRSAYLIDLSECLYFQSSRLGGGMATIKLVIELVSSDSDFVCIYNDHVTPHVHRWAIAWQIFASACTCELSTSCCMIAKPVELEDHIEVRKTDSFGRTRLVPHVPSSS